MVAAFAFPIILAFFMTLKSSISDIRATSSQIRRAAGGKDLEYLKKLLTTGWTRDDLHDMASVDGKGAVHMAAWHGSIEILDYLITEWDCDVNSIATGQYSYGKTPIFFACTRSRDDVVMFLLQRTNASVRIVNNKGQSVLSIAASHLKAETIRAIQSAEEAQSDHQPWANYRATHSDGLEYGDLDPRFLDRPLRETDVVTKLAINPTTRDSRRGNFARKNPQVAQELARRKQRKADSVRRAARKLTPEPTAEQLTHLDKTWGQLEQSLSSSECVQSNIKSALLDIVQCGEKLRRAWIPEAADRLRSVCSTNASHRRVIQDAVSALKQDESITDRQCSLLTKWLRLALDKSEDGDPAKPFRRSSAGKAPVEPPLPEVSLSLHPWSTACRAVRSLTASVVQSTCSKHLALLDSPVWVDSEQGLSRVEIILRRYIQKSSAVAIALDSEWYTNDIGQTIASTIQIAIPMSRSNSGDPGLRAWVVDLQPHASTWTPYKSRVAAFLRWMFYDIDTPLLGFAFAHDMAKLRPFLQTKGDGEKQVRQCLDIQRLAAPRMRRRKTMMPGLQACAAAFLSTGLNGSSDFVLSKEQQCSDWGRRPLLPAQLEYAGLDAAVLLVLLAEIEAKDPEF